MKSKQRNSVKPTLSDKIAEALTVKPRADIEDDNVFHTKPKTLTRAELTSSDSEDENAISDFRKRNVNLLSDISKKYEGKVVSRKHLLEQSDDSANESDSDIKVKKRLEESDRSNDENDQQDSTDDRESDDYSITKLKKQLESDDENEQSDDGVSDEGSDGEESGKEDEAGYDISQMAEPIKESFEHIKKRDISEETKKGNCVRSQLLLWENLLEIRIHMQRCVNTANRMPMPEYYRQMKDCNVFATDCIQTVNNVTDVLEKFLNLQNMLLKNFPETNSLVSNKDTPEIKTKEESDEEIPSDTDNEEIPSDTDGEDNMKAEKKDIPLTINKKKRKLEDYESDLATFHKIFKTFRDTTIQKWNDKTRLASATNTKGVPTNTILQQISYILSDRHKLIKRTQLKRSEYDIIGYNISKADDDQNSTELNPITRDRKDNDEYITEIFDDSDFYHQLLRELIECKSADISDPVQLSRQWIALQQMRSKMKRKVDTKATKGRRIKYVVHKPLVNYMAPEKSLTWNEESTNELYSSLFGKMFEQNNVGVNVNLENGKIKNY